MLSMAQVVITPARSHSADSGNASRKARAHVIASSLFAQNDQYEPISKSISAPSSSALALGERPAQSGLDVVEFRA